MAALVLLVEVMQQIHNFEEFAECFPFEFLEFHHEL